MAPKLYERCDDSNGTIGTVISTALNDLGNIADQAKLEPAKLAERVFEGVCANDYAQFDGLIALMAEALGQQGLGMLKAKFEQLSANPPARPGKDERRIIAYGSSGPMYEDDYEARNHARTVKSALTEIADALGDVDGHIARFLDEDRTNPAIAAGIAQRLLVANRAEEAMAVLAGAEDKSRNGGHWPDWQLVRIGLVTVLCRSPERLELATGDRRDDQVFRRV